jgi:polysaccharide biosynthesis protein PelG
MAGIGWRLERLIQRDTLGSTLGAFLTGVAVTSGPWLLTTTVLVLMRISAVSSGAPGIDDVQRVITVVYAVAIVLGAPIDIVLSRYASDRVYEGRRDQIAAPLRLLVAVCLVAFTVIGGVAMFVVDVPTELAVPGTVLTAVVAAQWLLLSAAGGLSSPGIILRAFAVGAPVSIVAATALCSPDALGSVGYLYGFGAGQVVTLALLLWGTLRALPSEEDESARLAPAFRDYWLLAAAALAFHAGLWIDKVVVYLLAGGEVASPYAATAAVAWLSVVPACAYLFVTIETVFHRRFRAYYAALHTGARLVELERLAVDLQSQVGRTLRGTAAVQACVTLVCLPAAPAVAKSLALGTDGLTLSWLLLGAGLQVFAVATTLLLYYFDFRREAFISAVTQLFANGVLTAAIGAPSVLLGLGYTAACVLTCAVSLGLLIRRMGGLLEQTFQSQPYASEEDGPEIPRPRVLAY